MKPRFSLFTSRRGIVPSVIVVLIIFLAVTGSIAVANVILSTRMEGSLYATLTRSKNLDTRFLRASQSAYTDFLKLDDSATMWASVIDINSTLGASSRQDAILADKALHADLTILNTTTSNTEEQNALAKAIIDTRTYETYFQQALDTKPTNHDAIGNLLIVMNNGATNVLQSDFQNIVNLAQSEFSRDAASSMVFATHSRQYITIGEAAVVVLTLILLSLVLRLWPVERALRQSEETYRHVVGHITDLVLTVRHDGTIQYASPSSATILGSLPGDIVDKSISDFIHPQDWRQIRSQLFVHRQFRSTPNPVQFRCKRRDGQYIFLEARANIVSVAPSSTYFVVVARDISQQRATEQMAHYIAHHDDLTGLPNRRMFMQQVRNALAQESSASHLSILFLDINRLKFVNDTLGFTYGDLALQEMANRMENWLPKGAVLSRLDGDRFALMVPDLHGQAAVLPLAEELLDLFRKPLLVSQREIYLSVSVGISVLTRSTATVDVLLRQAEVAMFHAKESPDTHYVVYDETRERATLHELHLENELRQAIAQGGLTVFYQPRVSLKTGQIVGAEALLRWNHPELGMVSPAEFIPIAEDTGLIDTIGEWVFQQACLQNKAWQEAGHSPIVVSVNVSPKQMDKPHFVEYAKSVIQEIGIEPEWMELELTERVMANHPHIVERVNHLKACGLKVSIDDFGTGYSSWSYLKQFDIDVIKIDQSFVRDVNSNAQSTTIVETMIGLAHSMHIEALAEGVETTEQLRFLQGANCDDVQGYYFSRPVPPSEFEVLLMESVETFATSKRK